MWAAYVGNEKSVAILLESGADVTARNSVRIPKLQNHFLTHINYNLQIIFSPFFLSLLFISLPVFINQYLRFTTPCSFDSRHIG